MALCGPVQTGTQPACPGPRPHPCPTLWSAGIIEGFKEEKAGLQEALGQKEASERGLVGELEGLRQQLQRAVQRQAELREENAELCSQTEALAVDAREREAGEEAGTARSGGLLMLLKGGGLLLEERLPTDSGARSPGREVSRLCAIMHPRPRS